MKKVLVIVDLQKDFASLEGSLPISQDAVKLTILKRKIQNFAENFEGEIICTMDTHSETSKELEHFPKHCIKGTSGWKLVGELDNINAYCVEKKSFSDEPIIRYLIHCYIHAQEDNPIEFHFVGVVTSICVHDVISQLVNTSKSEYNTIPKIVLHKDLCGDFDPEAEKFALKRLQGLYGVEVVE